MDKLSEAVKLAHENGMSYAQYQQMESQGMAYIANGKLMIAGKDYKRRDFFERNGRNTQRKP